MMGGQDPDFIAGLERARQILQAQPYPDTLPRLPRLDAMAWAARSLGHPFQRAPLAIAFDGSAAPHEPERPVCTLCGDCCTGCNYGAKVTARETWLADAVANGAEVFARQVVRRIERSSGSWRILFDPAGMGRDRFGAPSLSIRADVVVLAAGALGTAEILLRSATHGLPLSRRVGSGLSCNGDGVRVVWDSNRVLDGVGSGSRTPSAGRPTGPAATTILEHRDTRTSRNDFFVHDLAIPGALAGMMARSMVMAAPRHQGSPASWFSRRLDRLGSIVLGPNRGAMDRTMLVSIDSHDPADGSISLDQDRPVIAWLEPQAPDSAPLLAISSAMDAVPVAGPAFQEDGPRPLVIHPTGGCPMGRDAVSGAVDHAGRVYAGTEGTDVHPGLYVLDGSTLPRSLGVPPSLTIAALAERNAELLVRRHGWVATSEPASAPPPPEPVRPGLRFTERMAGHWTRDGEAQPGTPFSFVVTVSADDVYSFLHRNGHPARLSGTVEAPGLSPEPLQGLNGSFELFSPDPDAVDTWHMRYRLPLVASDGRRYQMEGIKTLRDDHGPDLWSDTTTLAITIFDGDQTILGNGVLRITPGDFLKQLGTMEITNSPSPAERLALMERFGSLFGRTLFGIYGGILATPLVFVREVRDPSPDLLRSGSPDVHEVTTDDGVALRLMRYHGGDRGPVILAPGFGVSTLSFNVNTNPPNIAESLCAAGFDTWLLDYRASPDLPSARSRFSLDDVAMRDWPAAVEAVRTLTGADSVQAIGHCVGSMTLLMALLGGLQGVRSIICSQLSTHPVTTGLTRLKARLRLAEVLDHMGMRTLDTNVRRDWRDAILDVALRAVPRDRDERCDSPVCRRVFALFGPSYRHACLDKATHDALPSMFGVTSVRAFQHITRIIRTGHVVDSEGRETYMRHLDRLQLPILFIAGAENRLFLPESTQVLYDMLTSRHGADLFERRVFPGYAHMDCFIGRDAARDVHPVLVDFLARN
jgi:cholesterol oxidase